MKRNIATKDQIFANSVQYDASPSKVYNFISILNHDCHYSPILYQMVESILKM